MNLRKALKHLSDISASELFVTVGFPLSVKRNNQITRIMKEPMTTHAVATGIESLLNDHEHNKFRATGESNCAIDIEGVGRFRISAFLQKGEPGMVVRRIHTHVPTLAELGLPIHLNEQVLQTRGLILLTGSAGSGKSTTMAAMIGHRNRTEKGHIIIIEDPIEFIHRHDQCIVTQRDVGLDTASYEEGLANALRQAPNIVAIGEIRSPEVMRHAMAAVETGHLCLATLHANNAYQALERVIHFFPQEQRPQLLMDLSLNIRAIVGQQLITSKDEKTVHPAVEILLNSPRMADLVKKGEIDALKELIGKSRDQGMQTFDQSLYDLYEAGKISYNQALLHATSANDLRLMIKLKGNPPEDNQGYDTSSLRLSRD
ncbi:PilT/PilU family type 4a pilus ATPase [Candidatus Sororendozoicomonas aggregata]|uniref:PilT/PilU family type 4a pilus ATPase n=1 Tax=Candidatus Sororendozoicomonas aggregata TaxID=3073239 RepID=UPI002ED69BEC